MKTMNCSKHGKVTGIVRPGGSLRCGKCASQWVIISRRNKKQKLVNLFGGQCQRCRYKKYIGALDFHHLDPSKKIFSLSIKGLCYAWDTILKEAKKCVLLCKNCHAETEAGI
ncbi:MAG TPA: hypothetical protein VMR99_02900 [Candidatus Paceibacterota bacterium]|nr:hypothetical protein [Candidatus Paceibacterota bacterium]